MAAAGMMELNQDNTVSISEWFCPGTLSNIGQNPRISIVVWDPEPDNGYQIIGRTGNVEDSAMLDGYAPVWGPDDIIPQVERTFTIEVESILRFSRSPHSDLDE